MPLRVTFELSNTDLRHFRKIMREARQATSARTDEVIIAAAAQLLRDVSAALVPEFVSTRLQRLRTLIDMLRDTDWRIPARERKRVLNALAYFTQAQDMIPDQTPVLGFLDDAIMIELVARELRHEIEAYEDFCHFREANGKRRESSPAEKLGREERLSVRRKALHERMRRRRSERRRRLRDSGNANYTGLF